MYCDSDGFTSIFLRGRRMYTGMEMAAPGTPAAPPARIARRGRSCAGLCQAVVRRPRIGRRLSFTLGRYSTPAQMRPHR